MGYPIYKSFQDKEDEKRLNKKDDFYPREGLTPSEERIKELQSGGYIGEEIKAGDAPEHVGGGYYELSNGERVKGKTEAAKAEKALTE